ncbi:MAG: cobalamin-binding protein [Spirochaetes bacterium]|nr:MAG: cobalamin-binding protein [Spirochaetota bacterium]
MRRNTLFTVIVLFLWASTLCFAGGEKEATGTKPELKSSETGEEESSLEVFPLTVTDDLGRKVRLEKVPERLVSLAPSSTEILFAVGAGEEVVGVTTYCNYPPEAKTREKVGGFAPDTISVEKILSLNPGLVISGGSFHQSVIDTLESTGITVYALDSHSFEEIYNSIETIGLLTGHREEALKRIQYMREIEQKIASLVEKIPPEKRLKVFWEVWDEPLMTAGSNAFMGQIIEKAGGLNIFSDLKQDYPVISQEEIVRRNPDVIMGPQSHASALNAERIAERPGWENISAVENGRIYTLDDNISSRPGPRIVNALGLVVKTLYPELFEEAFGEADPENW